MLIHPGVILLEQYLRPLGMTPDELADRIGAPRENIAALCEGKPKAPITWRSAPAIARETGTTPESWIELQRVYDEATKPAYPGFEAPPAPVSVNHGLPSDGKPRPRHGWTEHEDDATKAVASTVRRALLALPTDEHRNSAMYLAGICMHCGADDAEAFEPGGGPCQCMNDE